MTNLDSITKKVICEGMDMANCEEKKCKHRKLHKHTRKCELPCKGVKVPCLGVKVVCVEENNND